MNKEVEDECIPKNLFPTLMNNQFYTVTDEPLVYEFTPFRAYPNNCIVSYTIESEIAQIIDIEGTKLTI